MIKKRTWSLYLFSLPADIVCALLAIVLAPFQHGLGLRLERNPKGPGLWALTLDVGKLWGQYAAITIAPHVIFYRSGRHYGQGWSMLQDHEHQHCEQYEGASVLSFVLACIAYVFTCHPLAAFLLWSLGPWLSMLAGYAVAWLRGEDPYRGSINEESAYALSANHSQR